MTWYREPCLVCGTENRTHTDDCLFRQMTTLKPAGELAADGVFQIKAIR